MAEREFRQAEDTTGERTAPLPRAMTSRRGDGNSDPETEALRIFKALSPHWTPAPAASNPSRQGLRSPQADPQRSERDSTPEAESTRTRNPADAQGLHPSNVDNVDKVAAIRRAAEEWLKCHPIRANAKTRERYRRVADRMEASSEGPEASTNPNTFQGRKAAAFMRVAERLKRWLREGGDFTVAEASLERAAELAALKWSAIKPAKPTSRRSKANLSDLPAGWKERMFASATERLRPALSLLEIGGMRPEEIGRPAGVEVTMPPAKGTRLRFRFVFEGAKTGEGHGVAAGHPTGWQVREIVVDSIGERAEWLAGAVAAAGGVFRFRENPDHVKDNVRSLAKRLWSRRKAETRPSAYSYRHAFSAAQKAAGTDAATLAVAMGHRSERTQGGYGRPARKAPPDVVVVSARVLDDRPGDAPRPDRRRRPSAHPPSQP